MIGMLSPSKSRLESSSRISSSTSSSSSAIVDLVDLVHVDDHGRHADLLGEQDVLLGLRHRAVGGRHDQDRAVHLRGAGDHVLHIIGVARAIDVRIVARLGLILDVRGRDGDAALALFGRLVDIGVARVGRAAGLGEHLGDRGRQRRLAMVDVTDGADVAVRLVPLEFSLTPFCLTLVLSLQNSNSQTPLRRASP